MAKETGTQEVVIESTQNTVKSTTFSKKNYEWLVINSIKMLNAAKKEKENRKTPMVAELNGFFYASMAGLIRSGALCSRETGNDGFPEIHVIIQDTDFHCRENVLYAILGDEAPDIIRPYEDTFHSYVRDPNAQHLGETSMLFSQEAETGTGKKKGKYSPDELDAAKREIENLKNQMTINDIKSQKELVEVKAELKAVRENKDFLESRLTNDSSSDQIADLNAQIVASAKELADLKIENERVKQEKADAERGIRDVENLLNEEKEKKKEEPPEYEYYYREVLPKLAASAGMGGAGLVGKIALSLVSLAGIAASVWMILVS